MRWFTLLLAVHYFYLPVFSQPGFSRKYDLGEPLALFFDCAYVGGDTIAAYGIGYSNEVFLNKQGLLFAKFDTNGNPINHRMYFDSSGNEYAVNAPASFLKLQDGSGYMFLAQVLQNYNGVLLKTDNDGNVVYKIELPDQAGLNKLYEKIIETDNSFYVAGIVQKTDLQLDVFIIRVNKTGHKIWEKHNGVSTRDDAVRSIWVSNSNEIVLGTVSGSLSGTPSSELNFTTKIFAIDSLGNMKWNWESPASLAEDGPTGLYKSEEGYWCYTSKVRQYSTDWYYQPEFIKRDSNFNLVFKKRVDKMRNYYDYNDVFNCSFQTRDKGWFAAGQSATVQEFGAYAAMTYRLDSIGEVLWNRFDTIQAPPNVLWAYYNQLYSAVEIPGGSIIACGYYDPVVPKSYGWLLKIDRNGCVDTLHCMPVSTVQQPGFGNAVHVYPNPVSDLIRIAGAKADFERYEIVSMAGQVLGRGEYTQQGIRVEDLPPGAYVLRLYRGKEMLCRKVIKL